MSIKEAVQDDFDTIVAEAGKPVVVYFWATWCQNCKAMTPSMEAITRENAERFEVVKVDIEANPELTEKYNIMSTPTIMVFKSGVRPKVAHQGFAAKGWLMDLLEKYV